MNLKIIASLCMSLESDGDRLVDIAAKHRGGGGVEKLCHTGSVIPCERMSPYLQRLRKGSARLCLLI